MCALEYKLVAPLCNYSEGSIVLYSEGFVIKSPMFWSENSVVAVHLAKRMGSLIA